MPTLVGILTVISRVNTTSECLKQGKSLIFSILVSMSMQSKFHSELLSFACSKVRFSHEIHMPFCIENVWLVCWAVVFLGTCTMCTVLQENCRHYTVLRLGNSFGNHRSVCWCLPLVETQKTSRVPGTRRG